MPYLLAVYIIVIAAGFIYLNMRLTVEWVAIILFVAALLSGKGLLFLRDWGVFVVVLLAWQLTSGFATMFGFPWHLQEPIAADKLMFGGTVPAVWLQQRLYHPGVLEPWDVLSAVFYLLHFLAPLLAAFLLWMTNRPLFRRFAIAYVVVMLGGFLTYVLYPAVPPWMAGQPLVHLGHQYVVPWKVPASFPGGVHAAWKQAHVYLPGVQNLFSSAAIMGHWYNPYAGTIFFSQLHLHYDPVGAIPSEHIADPVLFFLFLQRQFGRWAYLSLLYIAGILFSITYMGQHYVIDAIIGAAYAAAGYLIVMHLAPAIGRLWRARTNTSPATTSLRPDLEEVWIDD
jgi:hypothetical protein